MFLPHACPPRRLLVKTKQSSGLVGDLALKHDFAI